MTSRLALFLLWLMPLLPAASLAADLDPYGGYRALPVAPATGHFEIGTIGNRWVFVSPDGNAFWMRAVYHVEPVNPKKYAEADASWPSVTARRLRSWGFNALGELSHLAMLPVPTYCNPGSNAEKMPFLNILNASYYGMRKDDGQKNLYNGIDTGAHPRVWLGIFPDVFDPRFEQAVTYFARDEGRVYCGAKKLDETPWLIGNTIDDGDFTTGFGPGPQAADSQGKVHPHLGWVAAVTRPSQERGGLYGQVFRYPDTRVYTKFALRDFLIAKYRTIEALNSAWKSTYTTFDSDGGWPRGEGLLDESGRNRWVGGDFAALATATPAVRADLDEFLYRIAEKYFSTYHQLLALHQPNNLIFGPATLQAGTREPILRAAAPHVDAIQSGGVPLGTSYPFYERAYDLTGRPVFLWTTFTAQQDASLANPPSGWGSLYDHPTQEARGKAYRREIEQLLALQGADGKHFIVGIDWWEFADKVTGGENMNFGLVTVHDNAYDGREAMAAKGGAPSGGEPRDFGDFLSTVVETHRLIDRALLSATAVRDAAKP